MSEKRRITLNTLANGTAQFTGLIAGFVLLPMLVQSFGLVDYGLYMIAQSVIGYASLLDLGVGTSIVKLIAEHNSRGEHDESSRLASAGLVFYLCVGAVFAVAVLMIASNAQAIFHVDDAGALLLRNLLIVAAVGSLFNWPLAIGSFVLQGHQRYTVTARTSVMVILGNIAVTLLVLYLGQGPLALLAATTAVSIAGGLMNTLLARRLAGDVRLNPFRTGATSFKRIFGISWALFVIQICTLIIYQQTDRLIIGVFIGAATVTLYEAVGKFQSLVVQLTAFSNSAVMPLASSLQSEGRSAALQTLVLRGTKYSLALVLPSVVALIVLAKPLLLAWMGPEFAAYSLAAQLFLSHQLLTPGTAVGDAALAGLGRVHKRVPYVVWILTVGNLAISLLLIKPLGMMAVVLGTAIPHLIEYPFHVRLLSRELGIPIRRALREVALPVYPALIVPLIVALATTRTALMSSLIGIAVASVLTVGSYWITLFVFGMNEVERNESRALVSRVVHRRRKGVSHEDS